MYTETTKYNGNDVVYVVYELQMEYTARRGYSNVNRAVNGFERVVRVSEMKV